MATRQLARSVVLQSLYEWDFFGQKDDLEKIVETNDAWIVERTGIKRRHIAAEGQFTSDIGLIASQRALEPRRDCVS